METKEFENLLSDYLDGRISEDCLEKLHEAIKKHPQLRRRFQREMRIHTLLYETVQEQNEHKRLLPRPGITHLSGVIRTHWKLFSSIAACLIAGVSVLLYFFVINYHLLRKRWCPERLSLKQSQTGNQRSEVFSKPFKTF